MGIPRFARWIFDIRGRQVAIHSSAMPSNIASLSFDLNSIIHGCAQIVYGYGEGESDQRRDYIENLYKDNPERAEQQLEKELFKLISDTILRIVMRIQPQKLLILAVDGVAPLAKINQQRSRRYRAASERSTTDETKKDVPPVRFDSNCITPGTDFMFRLDTYMNQWIVTNLSILPDRVVYSGHLSPGEGEQKIFDNLDIYYDEVTKFGAQVIYGLDADLVILSMICDIKGIYLIREKNLEVNVYEKVIAIDQLKEYLFYRMRKSRTAVDDFAVLTFFLGNDFVPGSPMFTGDMTETLEYLIDTYNTLRLPLTYPKDGKIDMVNLRKFIRLLASGEVDRLKAISMNPPKEGFSTLKLATQYYSFGGQSEIKVDLEKFKKNWYLKIFFPPLDKLEMASQLPSDFYLALFEPTEDKIRDLVMDYISAFRWIYYYYKVRQVDYDIKSNPNYCFKYLYAPLISDVNQFFPKEVYPAASLGVEANYSLSILLQLLAVLPPQSLPIVPKILHPYYEIDSPIVDMFPMKVLVDMEGKDMKHQGVVRMPAVQPRRLLELNIDLDPSMKLKYRDSYPNVWLKDKVQTIDRQIKTLTIKSTKEKTQEDLDLPEKFVHLDVQTPAKAVFVIDAPAVQDIIARTPTKVREEKVTEEKGEEKGEEKVTEEKVTEEKVREEKGGDSSVKKISPPKSAFAQQLALLKRLRK